MKRRNWILTVLIIGFLAVGCGNTDSGEVAVVEEIPIEQEAENVQEGSAESTAIAEAESAEEPEVEVNGEKGTITIGTTGAPFTELLTQAKIQLAKSGWDLQIEKYEDYQKMNEDVLNGTLDAHLFAHQTYIDSYNNMNGTNLTAVDKVSYEVYGVYSEVNQDLTKILTKSKIGIPADDTRKARALLFMQDMGWIVLKENVGMTAIVEDIAENTKELQFVEYTPETIPQVMAETDYCIIGADMAIAAGLDVEEAVLKSEKSWHDSAKIFASLLVSTEENVESEKLSVLKQALKSDTTKEYVEETYKGALALF